MKLREAVTREEEVAEVIEPRVVKFIQAVVKKSKIKDVRMPRLFYYIGRALKTEKQNQTFGDKYASIRSMMDIGD